MTKAILRVFANLPNSPRLPLAEGTMIRVSHSLRWNLPTGIRRVWIFSAALGVIVSATISSSTRAAEPGARASTPAQAGNDDVESLLSRLRNPSAARRREALLRLPDTQVDSERALSKIWPLLHDPDPMTRAQAARAVWLIGQRADAAVLALSGLLDPTQPQVCALASFLAGEIGPPARGALPALRARMTESDPLLRLHAAEAIAKIDPTDAAAHAALLLALHDKSADVRYFAACALLTAGESYDEAVRAGLLEAISDDDLRVASAAALSLESQSASPKAAPATQPLVPSPELTRLMSNLTDANPAVRRRAALRIAELEEAAAPAVRTLRSRLEDEDPIVRAYVACALWRTNQQPTTVVPTLIDLLGTTRPNVTTLATSVLAQIGPAAADALPTLYDLLESKDPLVRLHTAIAISRIDPRERNAVAILSTAAHDEDSDIRFLATLSLGHVSLLSRKRAERELTAALADRNLRVRAAAALAIENLQAAVAQSRVQVETIAARVPEPIVKEKSAAITAAVDATTPDTAAIPVLDEEAPVPQPALPRSQPSGDPQISGRTYDIDEETVEERKSITELRARITPSEGDLPIDHATPRFALEPVRYHGYGMERGWSGSSFAWNNPGVCHQPLYYQDLNLERYGYHYGCAQTFVSSVKFLADTALLPYKAVCYPYCDCYYTLGYDRPGNCVPYRCYRLPLRTDAAAVLTGVGVGLFFLAPP